MLHFLLLPLALVGDARTPHHAVHPVESTLYVEVPDLPALVAAYDSAPILQWARDPEWSGFAARALGEDPETFRLEAWCAQSLGDLLDEVAGVAGDDVDLRTSFAGLRSASFSIQLPSSGESDLASSGAVLVFDYATADDAAAGERFCAGALQLIAEDVQHKQAPLSLFGQEGLVQRYGHTRGEDLPPVWSASCGKSVVFGVGTMTPERWRALADDATRQVSLEDDPRDGLEDAERPTPLYRLQFAADDSKAALASLREQYATPDLEAALALLEEVVPAGATRVGRWSTLRDGSFESVTVLRGARWLNGVGVGPVPPAAAQLLPPDAVAAWATSVDAAQLEPLVVDVLAMLLETDAAGARRFLAEDAKLELGDGLLAGFGDAAAAYVMPLAGPALPEHGVVVTVTDRELLVAGFQAIFDALEARVGTGLEFRDGKYRGSETFSLRSHQSLSALGAPDLGDANLILEAVRPGLSIAVLEDRVVISSDRRNMTREVKRLAKPDEDAGVHPLAATERPYPAAATCASWVDWGAVLANVYDTATSLLSLIGGVFEVEMESFPPASALRKHFGPTIAWTEALGDDAGSRLHTAHGSFGPDALLVLSGGLAALTAEVTTVADLPPVTAPVDSVGGGTSETGGRERETTASLAESYVAAIEGYYVDQGAYPPSLHEAWGGPLLPDGWGRGYHYNVAEDGASYRLWSVGPNGIDESGGGDDLRYP